MANGMEASQGGVLLGGILRGHKGRVTSGFPVRLMVGSGPAIRRLFQKLQEARVL